MIENLQNHRIVKKFDWPGPSSKLSPIFKTKLVSLMFVPQYRPHLSKLQEILDEVRFIYRILNQQS